ncbi:putative DNA recombinase [Brevibacillus brevis NBRC 100599]|uniref:Putative DNA recombinase n=1 Tax=Brevibacillus brevis (strain 47 / JCM 6285 / NBRC 100599) TaxID=358681 RepID=C0ZAU8_BREBN|nr:recombinase family protein [Brevibacillus brevis]BAH42907.1 putative DNA recombinase [Brevibacillus brevis NBRC 100599]
MIGIYARVSTEEQAKSGFSLDDQLRECRKKAATSEAAEYVDDVSGEFLDRPALSRLRRDAKEGLITKIVCLDPDRLSRKLMNQLLITDEFDKRGIELVFVNGEYAKTPEGQLFYSMRGAIAEFEKAKINERMSRGRREKARQGRVLRDFQIYGYSYDSKKEQIVINEAEAAVVRLVFDLFTQPNELVQGMNGIAVYLTNKGVPTKRGASVWHRQVVRQMLMNEAYVGRFYQNKWNTEGMLGNQFREPDEKVRMKMRPKDEWISLPCPSIIDEVKFEHAQRLLKESRRRWAGRSFNEYLLSGLVRCGSCGNTMSGRKVKNWSQHIFEYTDVKNTAGAKNKGCGRRVRCEQLDNQVWETVRSWLNNPDEIAIAVEEKVETPFEQVELERLQKELEKTKAGRKRLLKLFASVEEDISEEDIRQGLKELKEKEDKLNQRSNELHEQAKLQIANEYNRNLIQEAADYYLSKAQDELSFGDKKELIRHVVREVRVYEESVEIYTF